MNEDKIKAEIESAEAENISAVCDMLKEQGRDILSRLADIVASMCDVNKEDLLEKKKLSLHVSQSRWLYWYTYRQMTHEPYNKMAERLGKSGYGFHPMSIQVAVNKMSMLISGDTIWKKRWIMLKRIIRIYNDATETAIEIPNDEQQTVKVIIQKPKNIKIDIVIKDE